MNIAYFTKSWPRNNYNSNLERTLSLLETLINLNHKIALCSDQPDPFLKQSLESYPLSLVEINPKRISHSLNNFTNLKFKPNLFLFDSFQSEQKYSAFLYNRWNKCPRVMTVDELPNLAKWRKSNYKMVPGVLVPEGAPMSTNSMEIFSVQQIRSINRCDYIFAQNQHIYHHMLTQIFNGKTKNISYIPFGYPMSDYLLEVFQLKYRPFQNRQNFVFIGNMEKQSNRDVVHLLVHSIWPIIRAALPKAQLHIYGTGGAFFQNFFKNTVNQGTWTKQKLKKLNIHLKGVMSDTQSLSQYKALLYPCVFSAGSHLKVIQSWFMHLPVVTTPVGAQGCFLQAYDPTFASPISEGLLSANTFSEERTFTQLQKQNSQKVKQYYKTNIFSNKIKEFNFGGLCNNFTIKQFAQSAIKIYNDEQLWNKCLGKGHKIIKSNQNDNHLEVVLKKALVAVEISAYESRGRTSYEQQWKRYTKSLQFNKKIRG